jgi:hypothetical protein
VQELITARELTDPTPHIPVIMKTTDGAFDVCDVQSAVRCLMCVVQVYITR